MHRVDGLDHVGNMFDEGDPMVPREATQVTVDWLNDVQENVARAVEKSGQALVKGSYDQLSKAIGARMFCVFRFTTGGALVVLESEGITSVAADLLVGVVDVVFQSPVVGWPAVVAQDLGFYTAAAMSTGPIHPVPNWQATPVPGVDPIAGVALSFFAANGTGLQPDSSALNDRMFAVIVNAKSRAAV